jgi:hypothetical protein
MRNKLNERWLDGENKNCFLHELRREKQIIAERWHSFGISVGIGANKGRGRVKGIFGEKKSNLSASLEFLERKLHKDNENLMEKRGRRFWSLGELIRRILQIRIRLHLKSWDRSNLQAFVDVQGEELLWNGRRRSLVMGITQTSPMFKFSSFQFARLKLALVMSVDLGV